MEYLPHFNLLDYHFVIPICCLISGWVRTQIMPRWLAIITFVLAVILLISVGFSHWIILIFPAWVLVISAYILYLNFLFQKGDLDLDGFKLEE